jgi:hypothetical protein
MINIHEIHVEYSDIPGHEHSTTIVLKSGTPIIIPSSHETTLIIRHEWENEWVDDSKSESHTYLLIDG